MRSHKCLVVLLIFNVYLTQGQVAISDSASLMHYLMGKDELVDKVLRNEKYKVQLIYTQVNQTNSAKLDFNTIDLSTNDYFYPASLVKLPVALLTLEKLKELDLSLKDFLKINSDVKCGSIKFIELSQNYNLSFEQMIDEMIVVSDNHYYNCLYHFLTPETINAALLKKGFDQTHIYKSFTGCDALQQLRCNSLKVTDETGKIKYAQNYCTLDSGEFYKHYTYSEDKKFGSKHEDKGKIVEGPYDFNFNLELPLREAHEMLLRLLFPENYVEHERWNIKEEDRNFIIRSLQKFPKELDNAKYKNEKKYPDAIYKYFTSRATSTGKIGISYGFTSEVAQIRDDESGVNFILSMVIYTNENDIVNDGVYEYESVARPFFSKVSELLYEYERKK